MRKVSQSKNLFHLSLAVFAAFLGACAPKPILVIRDREAATSVKKVAILPFFDAQLQSAYDPLYKGLGSSFVPAIMFDEKAKKALGGRYEIVGQDQSIESLKKLGVNYVHIEKAWTSVGDPESIRWGYTPEQGVKAGRALGVDAILMCAQGQYFQGENNPVQAISVRLVSTRTGKTLYGLNAIGKPGIFSKGKVVNELLNRLSKEAP
jgi:hypothetical protein